MTAVISNMRPGKYHIHILLVFLAILSGSSSTSQSTLRHVNLLYRHGDRSPSNIYPKDNNKEDMWPDGLGWLTNLGKEQQYKLGQYLRNQYGGFINVTHYDHRQINVESSSVDLCLMSAASNLAGLFPPSGDQIWDSGSIGWQPIPIHTIPVKMDNKLAMSKSCPRYDELLAEQLASKRVLDYQKDNKDLLELVSNSSGWDEGLNTVWEVFDTLICEKAHNMTWNRWAQEKGVFERLEAVTIFFMELLYYNAEMAKLKGGPLLKEMIENMKAASDGSSGHLKLHMYSAHDTTIDALLQAMTVFNECMQPYRTLVMVELHKINNDDVIKVFLRNDTTHDPYYLVPDGCEDPCKLSTFEKVVAARIPQDWDEECKAQNSGGLSMS